MYSHHLIPQFIWAAVVFLIGKVLFKSTTIGLAAMALFVSHIILDFFSGHGHHLFGANTVAIGLGLYAKNAYLAILIEALFMSLLLHIISGSRRTRVSFVPIKAAQLSSGFSLMVSFSCCRSPRFHFGTCWAFQHLILPLIRLCQPSCSLISHWPQCCAGLFPRSSKSNRIKLIEVILCMSALAGALSLLQHWSIGDKGRRCQIPV